MAELSNWPISLDSARDALKLSVSQAPVEELQIFVDAATELIDQTTGRDTNPDRWLLGEDSERKVPALFVLSARETVKLWWQQSHFGPRGARQGDTGEILGPPMGATLPRKVEGWLSGFPPPPGIA